MKLYKIFSLSSVVIFAIVGMLFLFLPNQVLQFFNNLSPYVSLPEAPLQGMGFYLALASAYMYLVTVIAVQMYRRPLERIYPFLLIHGKCASSLISLFLFLTHQSYLIYMANFLIDGMIALSVFLIIKRNKVGV